MNKKKLYFIASIVLHVAAALLIMYSIWAFVHCADIISQAKAGGQLAVSGNEYDIMSFYMSNCLQYFVYALLLAAAGLIVQKKDINAEKAAVSVSESADLSENDDGNDELDKWFEETSKISDKG